MRECCTARGVLWYLVFFGFAVNYMIRINLNIAIVAMIQPKPSSNVSLTSECLARDLEVVPSPQNNSPLNVVSPLHYLHFSVLKLVGLRYQTW